MAVVDVSAGVVVGGRLARPVKERARGRDLFEFSLIRSWPWDPAMCLLLPLLLALRIEVRVDRWFQVSAVLNWIYSY